MRTEAELIEALGDLGSQREALQAATAGLQQELAAMADDDIDRATATATAISGKLAGLRAVIRSTDGRIAEAREELAAVRLAANRARCADIAAEVVDHRRGMLASLWAAHESAAVALSLEQESAELRGQWPRSPFEPLLAAIREALELAGAVKRFSDGTIQEVGTNGKTTKR